MTRERPLIAFFDYPDVFEDFYPHYGVSRTEFVRWGGTGNHAFLSLLQREVGDVIWYVPSLRSEIWATRHEDIGCRILFVPSSRLHRALWKAFYLPPFAWRWRRFYRAYAAPASYAAPLSLPLLRALRRDRPDFFFVQSYSSGKFDVLVLLSRILGIPLIAYHAGGEPDSYLGRRLKRWSIPAADRLIASGAREAKRLAASLHVPESRIEVILTPIATDVYRPRDREAACCKLKLDPALRYLLFVGRLDDSIKRLAAIFRAFVEVGKFHHDVRLLVVGAGPDDTRLRLLADRLARDRIRFLGWVSSMDTKACLYAAAECLVLASTREGFPTVVGEAMACGIPVVSSRVGAVEELVVEGVTGWLFEPYDDRALEEKLTVVLSHPDLTAVAGLRARDLALRRVSPAAVSRALRQCFSCAGGPNSLLGPGACRPAEGRELPDGFQ